MVNGTWHNPPHRRRPFSAFASNLGILSFGMKLERVNLDDILEFRRVVETYWQFTSILGSYARVQSRFCGLCCG